MTRDQDVMDETFTLSPGERTADALRTHFAPLARKDSFQGRAALARSIKPRRLEA